jgi:hypothetical protein
MVHLCARCVGLYPALALGLAARLTTPDWLDPHPWLAFTLRFVAPVAGSAAWGLEQAGLAMPRAARVVSGVALGAGLGWVLGLHLRSPWPMELVELVIALGAILAIGMAARTLRAWTESDADIAADLTAASGLGHDPDGRKTDAPDENGVDPGTS